MYQGPDLALERASDTSIHETAVQRDFAKFGGSVGPSPSVEENFKTGSYASYLTLLDACAVCAGLIGASAAYTCPSNGERFKSERWLYLRLWRQFNAQALSLG